MNELQIFNNPKFGEVRTLDENGKILFCGADIAKSLGYSNPRKALADHCKGVTKRDTLTNGGKQQMSFVPEGDIYRLAASSELPGAEEFESWIFDEVLPKLRKTGVYMTDKFKQQQIEARLNNSRARVASVWMKIGTVATPEYKQICSSYASAVLSGGKEIIPLPESIPEKLFTATEVGAMLGISANKVGSLANANNLKTEQYGKWFYDKSRYSTKEVQAFRYNQLAVDRLRDLMAKKTA